MNRLPASPDPVPESSTPDLCGADAALGLCPVAMVLDALQCGAFLLHRSGRIVHVNPRLAEMVRRERGELVGRSLLELDDSATWRAAIQEALEHFDQPRQRELYIPRADGSRLPVVLAGRLLEVEGPQRDHRVVTVIDISAQKRTEERLQEHFEDVSRLSDTILEQALALKKHARHLEDRVRERTLDLHKANMEAIYMLAVASEAKDLDTGAHVRRIERYAARLAAALGLPAEEAERLGYSAILHDVGKIHIPDRILRKPAALDEEEWKIMRQHTLAGERILSREPFFDVARTIARSHHENWDGSGYPDGLAAAHIPLAARIVRVVDVYDALTSVRPYKAAWSEAQAEATLTTESGRWFDPELVEAFRRVLRSAPAGA